MTRDEAIKIIESTPDDILIRYATLCQQKQENVQMKDAWKEYWKGFFLFSSRNLEEDLPMRIAAFAGTVTFVGGALILASWLSSLTG